jgi:hypothetical protein
VKSKLKKLMILFVVLALCAAAQGQTPITVVNPSFELPGTGTKITDWSQIDGWSCAAGRNTGVEKSEFYSPVEGDWVAFHAGSESENEIYQLTGYTVTAGDTYTLNVWARSINPEGEDDPTPVKVRFYYGSTEITSVTQDVNPVRLLGDPRIYPNDDGGNVWLDSGYRMEFAEGIFYQLDTADPLGDPWTYLNDSDYDTDMANGPIITSQGFKGLYSTYYEDAPPFYSEIWLKSPTGSPPDYTWPAEPEAIILSHAGDEFPWVIDAHLYQDDATGKLWISWGGGYLWVSEMDPTDGMLIDHPASPEFDTHPPGTHTQVATFNGDEWSSDWVEGPALYKHNGYWYYFASYGNLAANYTIRVGRGTSPTGPFYDKDGVDMNEDGSTLILGHDGGQTNPGHPHIWEENGIYYMGFDYVDEYTGGTGTDTFGIRLLRWVDDWPVVAYTPIEVTFAADSYPDAIGQTLGIAMVNTGARKTVAAFDHVSLSYTGGEPDTDPPTPDPMTWASVPAADSDTAISMTATTASDPSGVEYYFANVTDPYHDSDWQDSTYYQDTGLSPSTQYCYVVKARDKSSNQNETAWSTPPACTTTLEGCTATDCHVEALVCSEQSCGGPNKNGVATVTIYDDCGDPVVGADVTGTFTGDFNEQVIETTDQNGQAVLITVGCVKKPTFQFCVDDVVHTLPYDETDNVVTCCND